MSPWRGPRALSQFPRVSSSRCMVSTLSKPPPAIYEIHAVFIARVDAVVARAGADLVVTFAGEDFVVPFATLELIVAAATLEAVVPLGPPQSVGTISSYLVDRQSHPASQQQR